MKGQAKGNFNRVAPIYDTLSTLVFGKSIIKAQHAFLDLVSRHDTVLILGGGTGSFLPALKKRIVEGKIIFVDTSAQMISRAMNRIPADAQVIFLQGTLEDLDPHFKADIIITHFFLDLFDDRELGEVVKNVNRHMRPDSKWIVSDFVNGKSLWQQILLKSMYLFFRIFTKLGNRTLPDWCSILLRNGYSELGRREFYLRFIRASVFGKVLEAHEN